MVRELLDEGKTEEEVEAIVVAEMGVSRELARSMIAIVTGRTPLGDRIPVEIEPE